ncbi:DsbA family oxidoreductase [Roseococcus sp. SYP-B2431]|uniref:DsbA family oxidoreductase n=1 Tax=Roseococcus sp. SYP-B2431 TaxID=2496640 RepID=UPI00103B2CE8|nr:DsbA family oxidoreductase [Roseococcus sp. SYP-B2431]TCI00327.1 DsbA family oxidoreductase [Roseococcus sp. SYP-B2431]
MEPTRRIDVISDAICPWCWIGKTNLDAALALLGPAAAGFSVHWRPFQLNPDMPPEGVERAAYRARKFGSVTRGAELDANVAEAGRKVGLEFRHDLMLRTPNTVHAHRLLQWSGARQHAMAEALFGAYFRDGKDIGDVAVLAEVAATLGLDASAFLASDELVEEVRAEDAYFRKIGISGVPSFAVDGRVLFSGAYPAEQIAAALTRQAA